MTVLMTEVAFVCGWLWAVSWYHVAYHYMSVRNHWPFHIVTSDQGESIQNYMMMLSNGNIFCVTGHLCREFTGHGWIPLKKASDRAFFDLCLIQWLSKQSRCQWSEMPSHSIWHHCNALNHWHSEILVTIHPDNGLLPVHRPSHTQGNMF